MRSISIYPGYDGDALKQYRWGGFLWTMDPLLGLDVNKWFEKSMAGDILNYN